MQQYCDNDKRLYNRLHIISNQIFLLINQLNLFMKKYNTKCLFPSLLAISFLTFSCSDNDDPVPVPQEGIEKASLVFTPLSGSDDLSAHGDHFHGLSAAVEGEPVTVEFNSDGIASSGGHLHLDPEVIYKLELQAWDYDGKRVEGDFVKDKATADLYKAFLQGGNFTLNTETEDESGAIFQPRDQTYGDGTAVEGQYETTGILSYFIVGASNEGGTVNVSYVLREFNNPDTKAAVTRLDWNAGDYTERFPGKDVLKLNFEIHAEHGHDH